MSARSPYVPSQAKPETISAMVQWVGMELERIRAAFYSFTGSITLTSEAQTVNTGEVSIGATTATTVGAAGAAAALPATPTGYLIINIAGTAYKVPFYAS